MEKEIPCDKQKLKEFMTTVPAPLKNTYILKREINIPMRL